MELTEYALYIKRTLARYANGRKAEVTKGRETPRFAALLVQKFGYGMYEMADAADAREFSNDLLRLTDTLVAEIDPDWEANAKARWAMSCVDFCGIDR